MSELLHVVVELLVCLIQMFSVRSSYMRNHFCTCILIVESPHNSRSFDMVTCIHLGPVARMIDVVLLTLINLSTCHHVHYIHSSYLLLSFAHARASFRINDLSYEDEYSQAR